MHVKRCSLFVGKKVKRRFHVYKFYDGESEGTNADILNCSFSQLDSFLLNSLLANY